MKILVLNSGSSSLKYQLIDMTNEEVMAKGNFERIGHGNSFVTHKVGEDKHVIEHNVKNHEEAIKFVLEQFTNEEYGVIKSLDEIDAVGHRLVHGGEKFSSSVIITDEVVKQVEECSSLAPLHNPAGILGIEACKRLMPNVPMVGVFDTAFHQTMPKVAYTYAIPYEYYEKYGIRKYGFHGTSHRFVSERAAELMGGVTPDLKIVTCHLGQGASIAAVKGGKCVNTSMGLTPLAGIPMGTRSGDLDPAIVKYLMDNEHLSIDEVDTILNKKSGVYGVSCVSPDSRDIEAAAAEGNEKAQLALAMQNFAIAEHIAKYAVSMQGIDAIVFTAGIGENEKNTREAVCNYLAYMGIKIDDELNKSRGKEVELSTSESSIRVFVIPTNEELVIARDTRDLVSKG
ncbi:MAG: acetate kinase [Clostridia bacterium]|nr:acetate kinase [Clostridia bacterium]MCI9275471.1 acetate kinase [Clostridia bacterium]